MVWSVVIASRKIGNIICAIYPLLGKLTHRTHSSIHLWQRLDLARRERAFWATRKKHGSLISLCTIQLWNQLVNDAKFKMIGSRWKIARVSRWGDVEIWRRRSRHRRWQRRRQRRRRKRRRWQLWCWRRRWHQRRWYAHYELPIIILNEIQYIW